MLVGICDHDYAQQMWPMFSSNRSDYWPNQMFRCFVNWRTRKFGETKMNINLRLTVAKKRPYTHIDWNEPKICIDFWPQWEKAHTEQLLYMHILMSFALIFFCSVTEKCHRKMCCRLWKVDLYVNKFGNNLLYLNEERARKQEWMRLKWPQSRSSACGSIFKLNYWSFSMIRPCT